MHPTVYKKPKENKGRPRNGKEKQKKGKAKKRKSKAKGRDEEERGRVCFRLHLVAFLRFFVESMVHAPPVNTFYGGGMYHAVYKKPKENKEKQRTGGMGGWCKREKWNLGGNWGAGSAGRRDDEVGPPQGPHGLGRERKIHKTVTSGYGSAKMWEWVVGNACRT